MDRSRRWLRNYRELKNEGKIDKRRWKGFAEPMNTEEIYQFLLNEYLLLYEKEKDKKEKKKLLASIRAVGDGMAKISTKKEINFDKKKENEEDIEI